MRHILLGIIWRKTAADPEAPLLRSPRQAVETEGCLFLVPDTMTVEEMLYKWIPIQSTKHKWSPKTYTQSVAMVQNLNAQILVGDHFDHQPDSRNALLCESGGYHFW